jgi:hypothetical protein
LLAPSGEDAVREKSVWRGGAALWPKVVAESAESGHYFRDFLGFGQAFLATFVNITKTPQNPPSPLAGQLARFSQNLEMRA